MAKQVVGFFCGTGLQMSNKDGLGYDAVFASLKRSLSENVASFGYDGCDSEGKFWALGGINANGTGEIAQRFVQELREICSQNPGEKIKVNILGHSRGGISAFKAVKKIQADPVLSQYVEVVLDIRDPVPGNIAITAKIRNPSAVSVKISHLDNCHFIKKAHITLSERVFPTKLGNRQPGFNSIIPRFSPETITEVEVLPMRHDEQEVGYDKDEKDFSRIVSLGYRKSRQLILEHSIDLDGQHDIEIEKLKNEQSVLYDSIKNCHRSLRRDETARGIHFGGSIVRSREKCAYLNLRHQKLACELGEGEKIQSILLGIEPPSNISYKQMFDLKPLNSDLSLTDQDYLNNWNAIRVLISRVNNQIDLIDRKSHQGEIFAKSTQKLKQTLLSDIAKKTDTAGKKGSIFSVTDEYAYQRLDELSTILQTMNSSHIDSDQKLNALINYENNSKKNASGWAKFGKCLTGFLVLATATVVGAVVGAAIGAATTSWTGPGAIVGAIAGGYTGAKITAAATAGAIGVTAGSAAGLLGTIGFLVRKNKVKKDNAEFVKSGKSLLRGRSCHFKN